jgi:beta-glucanase (GH16 family)
VIAQSSDSYRRINGHSSILADTIMILSIHNVPFLFLAPSTLTMVSAYLNVGDILWQDEFYGDSLNNTHWSNDIGNGCPDVCGWGNQELQHYTNHSDNIKVDDGQLHITARRAVGQEQSQENDDGIRFTSARIKTQGKVLIKYGQVEARILAPDVVGGLWPAFWTMGDSFGSVEWPASGEIDVLEMGSGAAVNASMGNRRITSGAYWSHADGTLASYELNPEYPQGTLNGTYVTVRLDWTPGSISTSIIHDDPSIEDFSIWKMDIDPTSCPDCSAFHQEHFLILNLAVGGMYTSVDANQNTEISSRSSSASTWSFSDSGCSFSSSSSSSSGSEGCGSNVTAPLPATMKVDWIRVIQNGYSEVRVLTSTPAPEAHEIDGFTKSSSISPTTSPTETSFTVSYPTRSPTQSPSGWAPTLRPSARGGSSQNQPTYDPTDDDSFEVDQPCHNCDIGDDDDDDGKGKGGKGKSGKSSKKGKSCKNSNSSKTNKSSKCGDQDLQAQSSELGFSGSSRRRLYPRSGPLMVVLGYLLLVGGVML